MSGEIVANSENTEFWLVKLPNSCMTSSSIVGRALHNFAKAAESPNTIS